MPYTVLSYLDGAEAHFGARPAVDDGSVCLSYRELAEGVRRIASTLAREQVPPRAPVGVFLEQSAGALAALLGSAAAGDFYSFFQPGLPPARLRAMATTLRPAAILTDRAHLAETMAIFAARDSSGSPGASGSPVSSDYSNLSNLSNFSKDSNSPPEGDDGLPPPLFLTLEEAAALPPDLPLLRARRAGMIDTDPLYVNFTSGSTGAPKGIAVSHRSVLDFIDCFPSLFGITEEDRLAGQAPFDFDVSVKDIYTCLKTGAELVILPRELFSRPAALVDFLAEKEVTTLIWAVSALCLLTRFHALEYRTPKTIRRLLFSGEVMPPKALSVLRAHLPEAMLVNLYGPTEITCNCSYHILDPARSYEEGIPLGLPFPNEEVFLLTEEGKELLPPPLGDPGALGEICVRGSALALGYYASPDLTASRFPQDPRAPRLPQRIYRTGDLGRFSEAGELFFAGRKDFQIKYRGHRIELEEIERALSLLPGVERCCCLFDEKKGRLRGYFTGDASPEALLSGLRLSLPPYMLPETLERLPSFPLTKNGKIDRRRLLAP